MARRSITEYCQEAIATGMLDLALGKYTKAERRFRDLVEELEDCRPRFKPYAWVGAFGLGLVEGIGVRRQGASPRTASEVAEEARGFFEAFAAFAEVPATPAKYRALGKAYATLGLGEEGLRVIDMSRHGDILSVYRLCPEARALLRQEEAE